MNWLQTRLHELNYTHRDLQAKLETHNIVRVRATITGWTNDKQISLLNHPDQTKALASVLNWSVLEMLVAAGYDVGVPLEMAKFVDEYYRADEKKREALINGIQFVREFVETNLNEEDTDSPKDSSASV